MSILCKLGLHDWVTIWRRMSGADWMSPIRKRDGERCARCWKMKHDANVKKADMGGLKNEIKPVAWEDLGGDKPDPLYGQHQIDALLADNECLRVEVSRLKGRTLGYQAQVYDLIDSRDTEKARAERAEAEASSLRRMASEDEKRWHAMEVIAEKMAKDVQRYRQLCRMLDAGDLLTDVICDAVNMGAGVLDLHLDAAIDAATKERG